ncbi:hypothetical protein RJ639_001677 [Escallonia herrerae]|uniref:Uncharacterized protein n=1 Tax=Escallonia herrerae TaxID=1293975 RepID=A0AA88XJJ1_9ASTE|nr:hypothetical protein RJ639_001677 [Escallonia herrerae]
MQSFLVLKKLLDNYRVSGSSYFGHWVGLVELYSQVVGGTHDTSRRVMYDSSSCITAILSQVAHGLKAPAVSSTPEAPENETLKQILKHARTAVSVNENAYVFPLHAFRSHSLLRLDIRDHDRRSLVGTGSIEVVDAVTKAFLRSKNRLSIYGCTMDYMVWEHPEEWRPERFLDENNNSVDLYKMMTFGGGKRVGADALQTMPILVWQLADLYKSLSLNSKIGWKKKLILKYLRLKIFIPAGLGYNFKSQ